MTRLTRRYRFSASHRLHSATLSDTENRELYGKCNNPYGHGHDYVLEVSVEGPVDPATGRVVDIEAMDRMVRGQVLNTFDHKDLNSDVFEFASVTPTTENLALEIRRRLAEHWKASLADPAPALQRVRIHETRKNIVEVTEQL